MKAHFIMLPLVVFPVLLGAAFAQTPPSPPQTPAATNIVTNAEEISVDLVVRDKKGRPVSDLQPADIEITDDGSPVKLSDLRLVSASQGASSAAAGHLVTLVFDQMEPGPARSARDTANELIKGAPGEVYFAVIKVDKRFRVMQGFSADREAVKRAIAWTTGGSKTNATDESDAAEKALFALAASGTKSREQELAHVIAGALEQAVRFDREHQGGASLACLLGLARSERQLAGRKAILYFSRGLSLDVNGRDVLQSIIGAANRAGVSIYTIDSTGLDPQAAQAMLASVAMANGGGVHGAGTVNATGPTATGSAAGPGTASQVSEQTGRTELGGAQGNSGPLGALAAGTGGIYFSTAGSVRKPLQRMIEDLTTYYEASYVPKIRQYDGSFHTITVTPVRAGLKIQARSGYFALPPSAGFGVRPFEAPLLNILKEPRLPSDVEFRSAVLRFGNTPYGNLNSVVVEVPLRGIEIHPDPNTKLFSVHVSVLAQIKNKSGAVVDTFSEDVPRQGALEAQEKSRTEVVTFDRHFPAEPGEYVLEAAVKDQNSGKVGAQRVDFVIPPPPGGPALSDIVLVRRIDAFNAEADPAEPLHAEKGKVVPNLSGRISAGAKEISLFFLVHADTHSSAQSTLEIEVRRDGEPIGRVPLQLRPDTGHEASAYMASIAAASLGAGRYQAAAILTQGGKAAESAVSFTLEGPAAGSGGMAVVRGDSDGDKSGPHDLLGSLADAKPGDADVVPIQRQALLITSPAVAVPPPAQEDLQTIVAGARERAVEYRNLLPNFSCVEITHRSIDPAGTEKWRHRDTIAELLRYHDKTEDRITLEVNGSRSDLARAYFKGTITNGEFGSLLDAVFNPEAKADIQWRESASLSRRAVQVFQYRVAPANSKFGITGGDGREIKVGYHGLAYIDAETRGVRRLTMEADDIPRDFLTQSAAISVDYDYVAIGTHDYLLPILGSMRARQGKRFQVLNQIEFRDYKRYAAESRLRFDDVK